MVLPSIFKVAAGAIWANKLRSGLTLLGVILGVTSVMTIVSALEGIMDNFSSRINQLGSETFIVDRFGIVTSRDEWFEMLKRPPLEPHYADLIEDYCPDCERISIRAFQNGTATYRESSLDIYVFGSNADYIDIVDMEVAQGRYLSFHEDLHGSPVVFIGESLRELFFENTDPIGKNIRIDGDRYTVIGVSQEFGSIFGESQDNFAIMPYSAWAKKYGARSWGLDFAVKARSIEALPDAMDQVRLALRSERKVPYNEPDNFNFMTADDLISFINNVTQLARLALVVISSISVVVGGIVVMNIMMVAVTERTREIGIRKSLGARKLHILWQFLFESLLLTLGGGLVGIAAGYSIAFFLVQAIGMEITPSTLAITIGLSISTGIGLIFGIYPALKAARLDPIKALSYE